MRLLRTRSGGSVKSRCILLGSAIGIAIWVGWYISQDPHDFTAVSLAQSPYLKDVVEPITIEDSMSFSDGGSLGLTFRDSRQILRAACLVSNWGQPDSDGTHDHTLAFGQLIPSGGRRVAVSGAEEQAFLGLLQRWARSDPDALKWNTRAEQWTATGNREPFFSGQESKGQLNKAFAVGMIRRLGKRN